MNEDISIFELIDVGKVVEFMRRRNQCKNDYELSQQFDEELQTFISVETELKNCGWFDFLQTWKGQNCYPDLNVFDLKCQGLATSFTEPNVAFTAFKHPDLSQKESLNLRFGFDLSSDKKGSETLSKLTLVGIEAPGFSFSYYRSIRNDLLTASLDEFENWKEDFPTEYGGIELEKFTHSAIVATQGNEERKKYSYLSPTYLCEPIPIKAL